MTETQCINRQLSQVEGRIEDNIQRQCSRPRKSKLQRFRAAESILSHSKVALMTVVLLNCIDCILVLSELLLDVYFIGGMIMTAEETMETFNGLIQEKYPDAFADIAIEDTHSFYNRILQANIVFNGTSSHNKISCNSGIGYDNTLTASDVHVINVAGGLDQPQFEDQDDPAFLDERKRTKSIEELLSTAFHKTSIAILGLLVIFIIFKVFCEGFHFLKHKLEVFDALVVFASFTLDLCYIRGLTNYRAESFILILVNMIPWRVIRVLNSLVIAVKDNYYFLLKLMYKRNKLFRATIIELQDRNTQTQDVIKRLMQLCQDGGIPVTGIHNALDPKTDEFKSYSDDDVGLIYSTDLELEVKISKPEAVPFSSACDL